MLKGFILQIGVNTHLSLGSMVDGSDGAFACRNAPYKIGDRTEKLVQKGEAENIEKALDKLMRDAIQANNGKGDTERKQRIKKEQKEQQIRKSRQTKDNKKEKIVYSKLGN
ncbi:MAG: hypothetical protein HC921_22090 [Synechococcaceae cyanobacterium SM2_3_1]|nr:hypothetical protein [Synechococcaceae cyanobacterium SM2_3_1]